MRRRPDDAGERSSLVDGKVEAFLGGFLQRHPRFFLYVGIALAELILLGFVVSR